MRGSIRRVGSRVGAMISVALGVMCASAGAQTSVCGPITTDTTWSLSGSPYTLTCSVEILNGALLTIEPGVEVLQEPSTLLKVKSGTLICVGTAADRIRIRSVNPAQRGNGIVFAEGGNPVFQATIGYTDFRHLNTGIQVAECCGAPTPSPTIDNCLFFECGSGMAGYHPGDTMVTNTRFENCNVGAFSAYTTFQNCTFINNQIGVGYAQIRVLDSLIQGNQTGGLFQQGVTAERNTFIGNQTGMEVSSSGNVIRRNLVTNNTLGMKLQGVSGPTIECNDVFGNTTFNLELLGGSSVNAEQNWWGSSDPAVIAGGIKDGFDQVGLGFVLFDPALPGPWATTSTCQCTTPVVDVPPASVVVTPGGTASFSVTVSAVGAPSFQWLRDGQPISPSFRFSGVNTATLTINPVAEPGSESGWTDAGQYSVAVSNVCGTVYSPIATLSTPVCPGDFNNNGQIGPQDIFDFLTAYFTGCP